MLQKRNINRGYMQLVAWRKAMELFRCAYRITNDMPRLDGKLRSQILNATQSVSANIAEGYCRRSVNEYLQFLSIGLGSLGELMTRMIGLKAIRYLSDERFEEFDALHCHVENLLLQLIRAIHRKKVDGSWDTVIRENSSTYLRISDPSHTCAHGRSDVSSISQFQYSIIPPFHHSIFP